MRSVMELAAKRTGYLGVLACAVIGTTGCASLDDHRRLQALNRNLAAEKKGLEAEIETLRSSMLAMRNQVNMCEAELQRRGVAIGDLRNQVNVLDQQRARAIEEAMRVASNQPVGDIIIKQAKLPERLDNRLRAFAQAHPGEVIYDAQNGTVKWNADLLFALGSDVVRESSVQSLRQFADILKSADATGFEVLIVGHTDDQPIRREVTRAMHPTNWHLSAHRAIAVSEVLQGAAYPPSKIGVVGYGQFRPVASNATEDGKSRNRRVEIFLVKAGTIASSAPQSTPGPATAGRPIDNTK